MEQGEPREIVESLLRFANHSLVTLDLTYFGDACGRNTKKRHFMGSLQGFKVLKENRVEYRMFWSKRLGSGCVNTSHDRCDAGLRGISETSWAYVG